ncbi:hypothetical protein WG66_012331 [Moniliophthora roreri]|nr:hypothetical protein WG66_012331 [Moniliophthora roreri]
MLMNGLNHSDQAFSRDLPSDPNFATLPIQRIKYLRSLVFNGYVLLNGKGIPHDAKGKLLGNEYKAEVDRLKTKGWVYVYEWPDEDEDGIRVGNSGSSLASVNSLASASTSSKANSMQISRSGHSLAPSSSRARTCGHTISFLSWCQLPPCILLGFPIDRNGPHSQFMWLMIHSTSFGTSWLSLNRRAHLFRTGARIFQKRNSRLFQHEFYRCLHYVTEGACSISPEFGRADDSRTGSRIDFFISSRAVGHRTTSGSLSTWLDSIRIILGLRRKTLWTMSYWILGGQNLRKYTLVWKVHTTLFLTRSLRSTDNNLTVQCHMYDLDTLPIVPQHFRLPSCSAFIIYIIYNGIGTSTKNK